jgi:hypothetical protein
MKVNVITAPPSTKGFDCNTALNRRTIEVLRKAGYNFGLRYAPRLHAATHDLTASEAIAMLQGGLALMVVQHVEAGEWIPSAQKGHDYGAVAAQHCLDCGISAGTMCWLDLESVDTHSPAKAVIDYCNNWYTHVAKAGFTPGVYVGWQPGLDASQLYYKLRFEHYWAAYNLNRDQIPLVRGIQMQQAREVTLPGLDFPIDPNKTMTDEKGGLPLVLAPEGWLE